jgi:hypothetical protein
MSSDFQDKSLIASLFENEVTHFGNLSFIDFVMIAKLALSILRLLINRSLASFSSLFSKDIFSHQRTLVAHGAVIENHLQVFVHFL